MPQVNDAEKRRIEESRNGSKNWRRWGPYLSERQWGTVREDYSPYGTAWDYFTHDQARSRAYRWGEDGIAGFSDDRQLLCLSLALWNGRDPILKERLFGLTNEEGNHGEDVKELYYYLDAVPELCLRAHALQAAAGGLSLRMADRGERTPQGLGGNGIRADRHRHFRRRPLFRCRCRICQGRRGRHAHAGYGPQPRPRAGAHPYPAASLVPQHLELGARRRRNHRCRIRAPAWCWRSTTSSGVYRIEFEAAGSPAVLRQRDQFRAPVRRQRRRKATSRTRSTITSSTAAPKR